MWASHHSSAMAKTAKFPVCGDTNPSLMARPSSGPALTVVVLSAAVVVGPAVVVVSGAAVVVVSSSSPQAASTPPRPAPMPTAAPATPAIFRKSRRL